MSEVAAENQAQAAAVNEGVQGTENQAPAATDAAQAKAAELGVDLAQVDGTGVDGFVVAPDVQAAADAQGSDQADAEEAPRTDAPSSADGDLPSDPTQVGVAAIAPIHDDDEVIVQEGEKSHDDVAQRVNDDWRIAQENGTDNVDPVGRFH